jgi:diketogulonate reductase-like aldo/keto reductase
MAAMKASTSSSSLPLLRSAIPTLLYGTAWKKERTADLVYLAISTGFRGIDTACQPKHYAEKLVGDGVAQALASGICRREELFLQTKFTPLSGQDPNDVPYDVEAPLEEQVRQSVARSLLNLQTEYLDSLVLHSPMQKFEDTLRVWRVFESFHASNVVRNLGISNCYDLPTLQKLYQQASVKPSFLQNRFRRETNYDTALRSFLSENAMTYQSFWTLTANPHVLKSAQISSPAYKLHKTPAAVYFAALSRLGIVVLSGTTNEQHMRDDLEAMESVKEQLTEEDVEGIRKLFQ